MNEIPKSGKTDCSTNKGEENSIFEKLQSIKIYQKNFCPSWAGL